MASVLLVGCHPNILIDSDVKGAVVRLDGNVIGKTPLRVRLNPNEVHKLRIEKDNRFYEENTFDLSTNINQTQYIFVLHEETTVLVTQAEQQVVETAEGLKVKVITSSSVAELSVIERSPNVKSVTRITNFQRLKKPVGEKDPKKKKKKKAVNTERILRTVGLPVISPDGKTVVYEILEARIDAEGKQKSDRGTSNIWKQPVNSQARTFLTRGRTTNRNPAFSPDGRLLYFSSDRSSPNLTIWRISMQGPGGIARITDSFASDDEVNVAPDGRTIAYSSRTPGTNSRQIWTLQSDGRFATQLREGYQPRISPDGKKMLYLRRARRAERKKVPPEERPQDDDSQQERQRKENEIDWVTQLWMMDIDGANETQLTSNSLHNVRDPAWSPDGKLIAYASDEGLDFFARRSGDDDASDDAGRQNFDIWIMRLDGTEKSQLTTNGSEDAGPAWSPDSKWIYFRSNRGGANNIWRFEPMLALTPAPALTTPWMSPGRAAPPAAVRPPVAVTPPPAEVYREAPRGEPAAGSPPAGVPPAWTPPTWTPPGDETSPAETR